MRRLRFRLLTLMIIIAFVALTLTVITQSVLLHRAAAREQQYRAELAQHLAMTQQQRALAAAQLVRTQAMFEKLSERLQQRNAGMMKKD
jgi:ABC-type protease/lipase transport system fused ATPase/permease subunit